MCGYLLKIICLKERGNETMSKTIKTVFLIIATLVAIFLAWQLVFKDGGILKTGYNAIVNGINGQWAKVAGKGQRLIPTWDEAGADTGSDSAGFEIDTN